jgi:hypothetical protein
LNMRLSSIAFLATAVMLGSTAAGLAEPAATAPATNTTSAAPMPASPAQTPAPAAAITTSAAAQADNNPIVCHTEEAPTGSRMGAKRICFRQSEWDSMRREARHQMDWLQSHNPPPRGN